MLPCCRKLNSAKLSVSFTARAVPKEAEPALGPGGVNAICLEEKVLELNKCGDSSSLNIRQNKRIIAGAWRQGLRSNMFTYNVYRSWRFQTEQFFVSVPFPP